MFFSLNVSRAYLAVLTLDTRGEREPSDAEWAQLEAAFVKVYAACPRFVWVIDMRHFNLDILVERLMSVFNTVHPLRHLSGWQVAGTVLLAPPDTTLALQGILEQVPTKAPLEVTASIRDFTAAVTGMLRNHVLMAAPAGTPRLKDWPPLLVATLMVVAAFNRVYPHELPAARARAQAQAMQ